MTSLLQGLRTQQFDRGVRLSRLFHMNAIVLWLGIVNCKAK